MIPRLLVVLTLLSPSVFGQDRGTIRGEVTDPTGASLPEATVTVKNVNTGLTQTAKTSADGVYGSGANSECGGDKSSGWWLKGLM